MIVSASGHRPSSLGGYHSWPETRCIDLATCFLRLVRPYRVRVGMAQGWDQCVAIAAMRLGIPWDAYLPFDGQERTWPPVARAAYHTLLSQAATVRLCTSGGPDNAAYQVRNMDLVDDCDILLTLWDGDVATLGGAPGGTANTIRYARSGRAVPRAVVNLWPLLTQSSPPATVPL